MRLSLSWRPTARLELLVLAISDRCDQKCAHCQIWMGAGNGGRSLTPEERLRVVEDALAGGTRVFLVTGGEPLLSPYLWPLAERLRTAGAKLMLATNGMLLERHAAAVGGLFDEVYLSLDGASASTHDGLRGVPAFDRLRSGVAALRDASPKVLRVARSTLHAGNLHEFPAIVEAARRLEVHHVSFLPIDASSSAFGGDAALRRRLVPDAPGLRAFEAALDALEASGRSDGFVLEPMPKLRRLARHLGASAGLIPFERPECDAPLWSSVVEADGSLRPCFFHEPVGDVRAGLAALRSSLEYRAALAMIRGPNPTCERCVCPKRRTPGWIAAIGGR
jgi:MoaA/NifB/PqqE/SkfB family radical SAM enzyme